MSHMTGIINRRATIVPSDQVSILRHKNLLLPGETVVKFQPGLVLILWRLPLRLCPFATRHDLTDFFTGVAGIGNEANFLK